MFGHRLSGKLHNALILLTTSSLFTYDRPDDNMSSTGAASMAARGTATVALGRSRPGTGDTRVVAESMDGPSLLGGISTAICGSTGYNYYGR